MTRRDFMAGWDLVSQRLISIIESYPISIYDVFSRSLDQQSSRVCNSFSLHSLVLPKWPNLIDGSQLFRTGTPRSIVLGTLGSKPSN